MREIETDIAEVDIVMIKPAIPYLDLVYTARQTPRPHMCLQCIWRICADQGSSYERLDR